MLKCCIRLKNDVSSLLTDGRIQSSLDGQLGCICSDCCIGENDIVFSYTADVEDTVNGIVSYVEFMSPCSPCIKKSLITGERSLKISAIPQYAKKIRMLIEMSGGEKTADDANNVLYRLNDKDISVREVLCRTAREHQCEYSVNRLIGKILSLEDILYKSDFLHIDSYPQVSLTLDGKLRYSYNFTFLHDLAVYITMHEESIDWDDVFTSLACMNVTTPLIVLLKLFNHIYCLIPDDNLANFVMDAKIQDESLPAFEILRCIDRYCTSAEILNNDYRKLYRVFLTTENSNGTKFTYPTLADELSFDESRLVYTLDHNTENPYGTPVFHGNANDTSDELSVKWGLWECGERLCFLLKIHNKFIRPDNPRENLEKCHTVIALSGADEDSHKLTEVLIKPYLAENGEIAMRVIDSDEFDQPLGAHSEFRYRFDGMDILFALAIDKSYLHIPADGQFGIDVLISCSEPWSEYRFVDDFSKSLTWAGSENLWRDLRSHAMMEPCRETKEIR